MYRKVIKDSRPFGAVDAKVVSVSCNGFIAVVQTIETIVPGTELKAAPKKNAPVMKTKVIDRIHQDVVIYSYSCILILVATITVIESTVRCHYRGGLDIICIPSNHSTGY